MRTFTIFGKPCGKGRPRFARRGNFVSTYTDKKTANYETLVRLSYQQEHIGEALMEGALTVYVLAYFPVPKSWSKKRKAEAHWHTNKPDCDNIAKVVFDALNGIAWTDDSQISTLVVVKGYDAEGGGKVRVMISDKEEASK